MNSQVLGGKGEDFMAFSEMKFLEFWNGEAKTMEAVSAIWNIKINVQEKDQLMERRIRKGTEQKNKIPNSDVLRTLFLAIFQNAAKHGVNKGENGRIVKMYVEGDNLCFSNIVGEKEKDKIEKNITQEAYRIGEGISQAVIFDICQSWYSKARYDEMFVIEKAEDSGKEWSYVAKLPILERRNGK